MKKQQRTKLNLNADTIRRLSGAQISRVRGGAIGLTTNTDEMGECDCSSNVPSVCVVVNECG